MTVRLIGFRKGNNHLNMEQIMKALVYERYAKNDDFESILDIENFLYAFR